MKHLLLLLFALCNTWLSFGQVAEDSTQTAEDSSRVAAIDSTLLHELQALQEKLKVVELQQHQIEALEVRRENDSIQQSLLKSELKRLNNITSAVDGDSTQASSESIKRNIIQSRLVVRMDLSQEKHYSEEGFPVIGADSDTLLYLYAKSGGLAPQERAQLANQKISELYDADTFDENLLHFEEFNGAYDVMYDQSTILHVSPSDARVYGISTHRLASDTEWLIRSSIKTARGSDHALRWFLRIGLALLVIIISWCIIKLVAKGYDKLMNLTDNKKENWFKDLSYRNYTFLTADHELKGTQFLLRLISWGLYLLFFYISLPILFSIFPFSRGWAEVLFQLIWSPFKGIFIAVWNYLPKLINILVIYFVMRYVSKFVKYIFQEIESEKLKISGFHTDWAMPTYQIVRFILYAFMFVLIFQLLPNADSGIFKGVSMFLGLLVSLGSSSAISNIVSGLVITYMRPFMIGDRIKINEVSGDVIEKTLLVTRIKTIKNEIITIPNSSILTGNTTNFSFEARQKGLIIHTTVTIGYDVPWKEVHRALIDAALKTELIMHSPLPFVLQTSLEDFYVSYQINAYTHDASKQAVLYSGLHANIQDICNERGIEILSPHYRAARDGNMTTIPVNYLPENYKAPSFQVNIKTDETNDGDRV